jgi:hypothetical protein
MHACGSSYLAGEVIRLRVGKPHRKKDSTRPYLKNELNAKGVEMWLKY